MDLLLKILHCLEDAIEHHTALAWIALIVSFAVLAKCASFFVDSSVALANKLGIPKLVIGIVLVSLATTAPELAVSLTAAVKGNPEMALGNAVGSVICDDGLALPAAGFFAPAVILIAPLVLKTSGIFLISIQVLTFLFVLPDYTLNRWEGIVLVGLFVGYLGYLFRLHMRGAFKDCLTLEEAEPPRELSPFLTGILFIAGLGGIVLASEFIVVSATTIAVSFEIPQAVIALTVVAFGTSIPEIATCITAARKGHGALAVGNIIGADILNICWVAGASSIANDLTLGKRELFFMFPAMFIIVGVMLLLLRFRYRLGKMKSVFLFMLYLGYLGSSIYLFSPGAGEKTPMPLREPTTRVLKGENVPAIPLKGEEPAPAGKAK